MSFTAILIAALVMSVLGLIFGALLGVTGRVFAVPSNPKVEALRECLPGANCGACGYPGCDGYAAAVAEGKAEVGACAVGGPTCTSKMAEIMGVSASSSVRMVATVACQGVSEFCAPKGEYHGMQDCVAASLVNNGVKACEYACLGLGNCERACPFDAIHVDPVKKIAVVDKEKCQSCKKCVAACPQHVLSMQPENRAVTVRCHNPGKGNVLKEKDNHACIGCEACVKSCQFGALSMENGVPKIDYEKCMGCMACADACPTGAMQAEFQTRKEAYINPDLCVGCTVCAKQCKFDAIEGALKQKHRVLGACTGCGMCVSKCPKKAIVLRDRRAPRNKLDKVKRVPVAKPAAPAAKPAGPAVNTPEQK